MADKTGSIQIGTGIVGTIYTTTGPGFRPAGVFFRWSGINAPADSGPNAGSVSGGYGFMLANGKRGCVSYWLQHAADPYTAGSAIWNTAAIVRQVTETTTAGKADFQSMNDTGFSLVIDEAFGAEITVFWWAISGVEFNAIEGTEPGAIGVQSLTGVGFRPTCLFGYMTGKTALNTPSADMEVCFGASSGPSADENGIWTHFEDSVLGAADTAYYCRRTECLAICNATLVLARASNNGFVSDGVELNWLERNSTRKFILVVASGRWKVFPIATRTDLVAFTSTGFTWTPQGVWVTSATAPENAQDTVASSTGAGNSRDGHSFGAGTGPTERWLCYTRGTIDGLAGISRHVTYHQVDEIYGSVTVDAAPVVDSLLDINSAFSPDTIQWIHDDADPEVRFAFGIAHGPPIIEFRQRKVRYFKNTYIDREAGRPIIRETLGRTLLPEQVQPDNWIFDGGPVFPTPVKYENLLEDPSVFYLEAVTMTGGKLKTETAKESLLDSLLRRLAG